MSSISRTAKNDFSFEEHVIGFFEANNNKTASGVLEDLAKLLKNKTSFTIPLMSDNCASMVKIGKISDEFKKIHCAAHKLAIINEKFTNCPIFRKWTVHWQK